MIIYKDVFSDDELVSDNFKLQVVDKVLWECDIKKVTKASDDIKLEGANPSAEDAEDNGDDESAAEQIYDIVDQFRLQACAGFDKKSYMGALKGYMKKVKAHLKEKGASEDEIAQFEEDAKVAAKRILGNYKNYEVFIGESFDSDAMLVLIDYREDGMTPYATFWKDGLKEYKV
ncbi:translationally-controlled tumor protein [Aspergillus pseudotamarii]|uniref:Translationally-controlled tumor protein homolog n=1 Tax=Aspergillus pseudotamarii TaxID=132259 RepID=A0A5N6T8H2_ASPPS|nr:translationally-controlled tumor protein [Aspergillus pseudotamarii]KAE8142499.1 translationally-controlled tumor protein [Aspergillus pseudotamarii]